MPLAQSLLDRIKKKKSVSLLLTSDFEVLEGSRLKF